MFQAPDGVGVVYTQLVLLLHRKALLKVCQSPNGVGVVYTATPQTRTVMLFFANSTYKISKFFTPFQAYFNIKIPACQYFFKYLRNNKASHTHTCFPSDSAVSRISEHTLKQRTTANILRKTVVNIPCHSEKDIPAYIISRPP